MKRFVLSLVLAAASATMLAVTNAVPLTQVAHPLHVTTCNPQQGQVFYGASYAPAYYPYGVGPYWGWPSVYGPMYYSYPVQGSPTLAIDYSNATNVTMKEIEFGLIANKTLVAEVRDVGTFSPGAEIKHEFGLSDNVFPLSTSIVQCLPLKITFADGTKWKNPHLPAIRDHSMYGGHPHANHHYVAPTPTP